jgi:predicted transcriptional regulator YdeE
VNLSEFHVIGISIRTTNENGQSGYDIPKLWQRFSSEGVLEKIPNKMEPSIYAVYTEYEGDFMKPYTTVIGCKVADLLTIPEGMVGIKVSGGKFTRFTAKGGKEAVLSEWMKIWSSDLRRSYTSDFEVYGAKAQDPQNPEIDIFIAVR